MGGWKINAKARVNHRVTCASSSAVRTRHKASLSAGPSSPDRVAIIGTVRAALAIAGVLPEASERELVVAGFAVVCQAHGHGARIAGPAPRNRESHTPEATA